MQIWRAVHVYGLHVPWYADLQGYNLHMGEDVYMNFGCVLLDCNTISIGVHDGSVHVDLHQADMVTVLLSQTVRALSLQATGPCSGQTCRSVGAYPWNLRYILCRACRHVDADTESFAAVLSGASIRSSRAHQV
jgi:hypothetical protein